MKKHIKEQIWDLVEEQVQKILEDYPESFEYNENSKFVFLQKFDDYTNMVKSNFMHEGVEDLDRHKVAAIIICSIIEANVIRMSYECKENELFDGNEKIAVNIGLSYMKSVLLMILENTAEKGKFKEFSFPKALACETDYVTILCRNLYYAKSFFILNPLDIANILFLLENFSLAKENVDLEVLRLSYK